MIYIDIFRIEMVPSNLYYVQTYQNLGSFHIWPLP